MKYVCVLALVLSLGACSLNLGAEKLQLDAKTAEARKSPPVRSVRGDFVSVRKVYA